MQCNCHAPWGSRHLVRTSGQCQRKMPRAIARGICTTKRCQSFLVIVARSIRLERSLKAHRGTVKE